MKHQRLFTTMILTCVLFLALMIYMGTNATALKTKKSVFTFPVHESIPTSPSYYVKGVIKPDRVKVQLDYVDIDTPGYYKASIKQSNRTYEFTIHIK